MPIKISPLPITNEQKQTLETWIRALNTPQIIALRSKIVLLAADGLSNVKIAQDLKVNRSTVILWRERFLSGGTEALTTTLPGRGRRVTYSAEKVQSIVEATTQTKPPAATLQRTQPGLPIKKGRCGTMTHDYKRHGTTTLFAALNTLDGRVIGECMSRHRHQEFLRFLRRLDKEYPGKIPLHLILDNYGTHKQPKVKQWLEKHPRFNLHFTPTSSSWLNLVERWFREITEKRIRRDSFESVPLLIAAIEEYLAITNENPKPFVWHKSAQTILDKVAKCRAVYETLH